MITTWIDVLIRLSGSILNRRERLAALDRDRRDRVADYFEQIAHTLDEAAVQFERSEDPWNKYREVEYYLRDFIDVVRGMFAEQDEVVRLYEELDRAMWSDFLILHGTRERAIVDAITVRPRGFENRMWQENPVRDLSEKELHVIIKREVDGIKEVAGLFRGVAVTLRATPPPR